MNEGGRAAAGSPGLLVSLRQLVASGLELAQVRLELLGTELEAEKLRIASGLIWAALALVFIALALVLFVGCVLLMFWDGYRLQAAAVLLLLCLVGGVLAWRHALARLKTPPGPFPLSVAELARDRARLDPGAEMAAPPRRT
jgi:uncharacterized membrane protein YqjE